MPAARNHVMNDLRPYACTTEDCSRPDQTYSTVKGYLFHEIYSHEVQFPIYDVDVFKKIAEKSITCLFCGQQTTEGRGQHSRGRHVGQHIEEIAFMVVPKAYEDWEFYSEASSGIHMSGTRRDAFAAQQQQSRHDFLNPPKTISPKEVSLDYNDSADDLKKQVPLFPSPKPEPTSQAMNGCNASVWMELYL